MGVQIDPLLPESWSDKIISLYFTGKHDEAVKSIDEALNLHANTGGFIPSDASRVYLYLGMYEKVIETINTYLKDLRAPRPLGTLALAHYHLGNLEEANKLLEEIKAQSETTSAGSPAFYVAMIYTQMGEIDTAFEWLEKAYKDHEVEMYWLKVEPPFEPLRSDPRWQEMLDKVGFPE